MPSLSQYALHAPFDRTLRVPLRTPRGTLHQPAVIIAIALATVVAGLMSSGGGARARSRSGPGTRGRSR